MPAAKKKPKPRPPSKPRWRDSARQFVKQRPLLTWGSAASMVALVGSIWTGGAWFFGRFQLAEASDAVIKELRKDAAAHEKKDAQERIENMYGQQRIETLILRARVNDCNAKSRSVKGIEVNICAEYQQEFREAQKRTDYLYQKVQEGAK